MQRFLFIFINMKHELMKMILTILFLGMCLPIIIAQENKQDPRIISIIESIVPDTVYINEPFIIAQKIQGNFHDKKIKENKYENVRGLDSISAPKWLYIRMFNYVEDRDSNAIDISDLPKIGVQEYYLVNELRAHEVGRINLSPLTVVYKEGQTIIKVISEEKEIVVLPSRQVDRPQMEVLFEKPARVHDCLSKFKFTIKVKGRYSSDLRDVELGSKKLEKYLISKFEILKPKKEQIGILMPYFDRGEKLQVESFNIYEWELKPKKAMNVKLPAEN